MLITRSCIFIELPISNQLHQVENYNKIQSCLERCLMIFPLKMSVLGNKKILAAVNQVSQEEHPRNNLSQDTNVLRVNEVCITQVSEQIEEKVTKTLPQEFSQPQNWSLARYRNCTISFWTRNYGCNAGPFCRLPGNTTGKIRSTTRTVPKIFLFLKWLLRSTVSLSPWLHTLTRYITVTSSL